MERVAMRFVFRRICISLLFIALFVLQSSAQTNEQRSLVLVVGASGEPEFGKQFSDAADLWKQAAAKGGLEISVIAMEEPGQTDDRTRLLNVLSNEIARPSGELWIVFLGHGTFDGHAAKFNLRGPDISAAELAAVLKPCKR